MPTSDSTGHGVPAGDSAPRVMGRTPIAEAGRFTAIEPVLVIEDEPLEAVIRRAYASPATSVLAVVNGPGVLVGVLTAQDLVAAVVGRLAPGALLAEIHDADDMDVFDRFVEARTARDLMQPPASIRASATVGEAFRAMRDRRVSGVYVVDESGRPVAYVDGLELAAAVIGAG